MTRKNEICLNFIDIFVSKLKTLTSNFHVNLTGPIISISMPRLTNSHHAVSDNGRMRVESGKNFWQKYSLKDAKRR